MRSWGPPLVVSFVLHAALLGGMCTLSSRSATPAPLTETRIVQLVEDEPASKKTSAGPSANDKAAADTSEFEPVMTEIKTPSAATMPGAAPVVTPPYLPGHGHSGTRSGDQRGTGAGSSMFVSAATARSVVYVLDRSGSMGQQDAYRRACEEVLAHVGQLPATTRFQVVPYNSTAQPLCVNASTGLLPSDANTVQKVKALLAALPATGWTDHLCGLKRALSLSPDVLYLVTDADDLTPEDVKAITTLNRGRTVMHTIEMHSRYGASPTGALSRLAANNKGTYRRVLLED